MLCSVGIYAFVVLKENVPFGATEQVRKELRTLVKEGIASYAVPELLQVRTINPFCKYHFSGNSYPTLAVTYLSSYFTILLFVKQFPEFLHTFWYYSFLHFLTLHYGYLSDLFL